MAKRELQEINAGSMADIAFLLLIFFLVATTMDIDTGLTRLLPPIPDKEQHPIRPHDPRHLLHCGMDQIVHGTFGIHFQVQCPDGLQLRGKGFQVPLNAVILGASHWISPARAGKAGSSIHALACLLTEAGR